MPNPITVYLDSNDFSALSDPKQLTPELMVLGDRLSVLAQDDERVRFVYSSASVCEMAPVQASSSEMAERRATLLSKLCKRNALISFDRLVAGEQLQVSKRAGALFEPISGTGDWFPEMGGFMSPVDLASALREKLSESKLGSNRKQRRALASSAFKRKLLNPAVVSAAVGSPDPAMMKELLAEYPMRPEDASVLWDFVLGKASKSSAEHAFLESLRDPSWMMQWFERHHDRLLPIVAWLRDPAAKAEARLQAVFGRLQSANSSNRGDPIKFLRGNQEKFISELWADVYSRVTGGPVDVDGKAIAALSPGLNVAIRALYEVFVDAAVGNRQFKTSDFVDIVHATYSPYVDIYRADKYMAPYISRVVAPYGTTVVSKLTQLPEAIQRAVDRRAPW